MTTLHVLSGPERGRSFRLRPGDNFAGRSPENDIRIEDRTVSRNHLRIRMKNGRFFITDLKSQNGTFYDGAYLRAGTEVEAKQGVPIAIGMSIICIGEGCEEQIQSFQDTTEISRRSIEQGQIHLEGKDAPYKHKKGLLYRASTVLMEGRPIEETLEKVLDCIFDVLKRIDRGAFVLVDSETKEVQKTITRSNLAPEFASRAYSERVVQQVLGDGKSLVILDVQTKEDELVDTLKLLKIECVMCVPIVFGSRMYGVIYVDSLHRPYGFRQNDVSDFIELGSQVGLAMERAQFASEISTIADLLSSES